MKILYKEISVCSKCPYFKESLKLGGQHRCGEDNRAIGFGTTSHTYRYIHVDCPL